MQEEKPINLEAEVQKQITCRVENKDSSEINLDKIKNSWTIRILGFLTLLLVALILAQYIATMLMRIMPQSFVETAMSIYNNNSTKAEMHISVANNLLLSAITFVYVLLTWNLATQSKESIAQSRKEQQIRDIENRLEKFYIPADDIINLKHKHRENTVNGYKRNTDGRFVQGLQDLRKYSYLADKKTYEAYEKYMSTNCTKLKSTTCRDKYGEFHYCEHHEYNCHEQWETCTYNLEYCEYHPDHGKTDNNKRKDHTKCTVDNANCKNINHLKKEIVRDIENYKNELLRLKK